MKREDVLASYLINLGEEVFKLLLMKGAKKEDANENKNKSFDNVEILGVMLTGQAKNFKALENQNFIRGASVGAIAQIVPYIKPEK